MSRFDREAEVEEAIAREVAECAADEPVILDTIQVEGTEEARRRFAEKMRDWRENGGIPGYNGPRAVDG